MFRQIQVCFDDYRESTAQIPHEALQGGEQPPMLY